MQQILRPNQTVEETGFEAHDVDTQICPSHVALAQEVIDPALPLPYVSTQAFTGNSSLIVAFEPPLITGRITKALVHVYGRWIQDQENQDNMWLQTTDHYTTIPITQNFGWVTADLLATDPDLTISKLLDGIAVAGDTIGGTTEITLNSIYIELETTEPYIS